MKALKLTALLTYCVHATQLQFMFIEVRRMLETPNIIAPPSYHNTPPQLHRNTSGTALVSGVTGMFLINLW